MKIKCPRFIKAIFRKLFDPVIKLYYYSKDKVSRSIRMELVVTFVVCLLSSIIVSTWYNGYYNDKNGRSVIDYGEGIKSIENRCINVKNKILNGGLSIKDEQTIGSIIRQEKHNENDTVKIFVVDLEGKVLYKSNNADEKELNVHDIIRKSSEFKRKYENDGNIINNDNGYYRRSIILDRVTEYVNIDSLEFSDGKGYVIVRGIPEGNTTYIKANGSIFSWLLGMVVFVSLFYFITNTKMKYIEGVSEGLFQIAKGNLAFRLPIQGKDELAKLSDNINFMAKELKNRIDRERNAERTKSELITNVSHDLRTPLTSIKGYLGLVKDNKYRDDKEMKEFLNIAYNKSEKLEILINDLFEYTKLSNKGITLNKKEISLNELLEQLVEELYIICEKNNMIINKNIPDEKICAFVDGDKMVRVFENLLMNAVRYSPKPGEINLTLQNNNNNILVYIENRCENINEEDLKKIFDRFYRVDKSRSQATGGSGLGLAIAKSIIELHGGKIGVELKEDKIIFGITFSAE